MVLFPRPAGHFCFLAVASLFLHLTPTAAQDLVWAHRTGSVGDESAGRVATDSSGNVYVTGSFEGTVDFDPGPGATNLTSSNGSGDAFIAKYNSSGALVWVKRMGGSSEDSGVGITLDSGGNIFITGYFNGTADFDPGAGVVNLTSKGGSDVFVAKFANSGSLIWAKQFGGGGDDESGVSIAVDAGGNVVTTGVFVGVGDFDPGAGVFNLTAAGYSDIFVAKLDSNGGFAWAKRMGGGVDVVDDFFDVGTDIAVDLAGNIYATGFFLGTGDFDPGPGVLNFVSAGKVDTFVSKFAPDGALLWARQLGGAEEDAALTIALDANANVYTSGAFGATTDFDPGAGVFSVTADGEYDLFVWKLDTNGNFVWVRTVGGPGSEIGATGMAVDASGGVYTSGLFTGQVDFDPGPGTFHLTGVGAGDAFVAKIDNSGGFSWAIRTTGSADGFLGGLALDGMGNMYAVGSFDGVIDFDPGPGSTRLTTAGGYDFFLAKLKDNSPSGVAPVISSGGIVMANLVPTVNTVSPLSIISVFGQGFSAESVLFPNLDGQGRVDTILGGTCLMMDDVALPIFAMTPTQINAQVSAEKSYGPASFTVISNCGTASALASEPARFGTPLPRELTSVVEMATVEQATPAFFIFDPVISDGFIAARFNATETQPAAAVAPDGMFLDEFGPSRPAKPGDIILLYGTGWGETTTPFCTGVLADAAASMTPEANPSITFGGIVMEGEDIFYIGVTPGTAGLYQAAIQIPETAQAGNNQVVLTVYGKSTPVGPVVPVSLQ